MVQARRGRLDRLLIVNCRQLGTVVREYVEHYNSHRPRRYLGRQPPLSIDEAPAEPGIGKPSLLRRANRLGGLIHEYRLVV